MEQKLSRDGHRKRMRHNYVTNGISVMEDHNILELFLSLVIPQKDVKPLAYDLMNNFGSLENVLNASVDDLMQINGIGESSAVAISLVKDINNRVNLNKNRDIKKLNNSKLSQIYVKNILSGEEHEKLIMITLDNSMSIIKMHIIVEGTVNNVKPEPKKIIECALKDNASSIIIAHNHPHGKALPSNADINFTLEVIDLMRKLDIDVNDHIIVGESDVVSMNSDVRYMLYFDN